MKSRIGRCLLVLALFVPVFAAGAPYLYVPNTLSDVVSVVDIATNTIATTVRMPGQPRQAIATSDGRYVYVLVWPIASLDYTRIVVVSTSDNTIAATIPLTTRTGCGGMALSPDSARLYANCGPQGVVVATATNQIVGAIPASTATPMAVTLDRRYLYEGDNTVLSGSVVRLSLETLETQPVDGGGHTLPGDFALSADGSRLYVLFEGPYLPHQNLAGGAVGVYDPASGALLDIWAVEQGQPTSGFALSPDGRSIYVALGAAIAVLDATTGQRTRTLTNAAVTGFSQLAGSPDGRYLYSAQAGGASLVRVDVSTGEVSFLQGFANPIVNSTAITPLSVAQGRVATAVEYVHPVWGYYFVTSFADEIALLDQGGFGGAWQRTGMTFGVWATRVAAAWPTCRFFSTHWDPRSSHFYTPYPAECASVGESGSWLFESIAFYVQLPDESGVCPAGTQTLYRLYNNGLGGAPNHRYTTDAATFSGMRQAGWTPEGNGMTGAFACVPSGG